MAGREGDRASVHRPANWREHNVDQGTLAGLLDAIGLQHGTDKASDRHDYLRVYEQQIPYSPKGSLLELGWLDGASMSTWRDWLPEAWTVTGLDIEVKLPMVGVNFVHGNQDDGFIIAVTARDYGPFDVIIDDASHINPLTIASFTLLWEHLAPGGLYFIEDLQVSYYPEWKGNPDPDKGNTIMQFLKSRADDVHNEHCGLSLPGRVYDVRHVAFWPGLALVQKDF